MIDEKDWWKYGVTYQIYPRSYKDSNGDGVGDLAGITDKMDYIASLGVDALWISPFFKSPMKDFGYDISDYRTVDPVFGANEDFDILLKRAHDFGIKIIIDLVLSHTSNEHPWFIESRSSRDNARADWYVWADPKPDGSPPNNWQSVFSGAAWTFDTRREQYYLHNFLTEQPDLNFHCEDVQKALLEECRYWLERGVDGFRLDVVNFYFCDKQLRDNPPRDADRISSGVQYEKTYPYIMQKHLYDKSQPENIAFLQKIRAMLDEFGATMAIGELGDDDPYKLSVEYTNGNDLLHTCYNTHMMSGISKPFSADLVRAPLELYQSYTKENWPSWALTNHDVVRAVTRWGKDVPAESQQDFAILLIAIVTTLRGSAYLYQGEELGLPEATIPFEKIQDPWGKALWPEWQGRDGCRTPMPWSATNHHAGFSTAEDTWLPVPDTHIQLAADKQNDNPQSVLNFTRAFLKWRKTQIEFLKGDMEFIDHTDSATLIFRRKTASETFICAFNGGGKPQTITGLKNPRDLMEASIPCKRGQLAGDTLSLPAYGLFIGIEEN